jgi:hypothetical protein
MQRLTTAVVGLTCALAAPVSSEQFGVAYDCGPVTFKLAVDNPDVAAIYKGVVDQIEHVTVDSSSGSSYGQIATFRVSQVWKGDIKPDQTVVVHYIHPEASKYLVRHQDYVVVARQLRPYWAKQFGRQDVAGRLEADSCSVFRVDSWARPLPGLPPSAWTR